MNKLTIISTSILLLLCQLAFGQIAKIRLDTVQTFSKNTPLPVMRDTADRIFVAVEQMAQPKGGFSSFYANLMNSITWDRKLLKEKVVGDIEITFLLDRVLLTDFDVIKDEVGCGVADSLIATMKAKPWTMGIRSDRPLNARLKLCVRVDCSGM